MRTLYVLYMYMYLYLEINKCTDIFERITYAELPLVSAIFDVAKIDTDMKSLCILLL